MLGGVPLPVTTTLPQALGRLTLLRENKRDDAKDKGPESDQGAVMPLLPIKLNDHTGQKPV